jgi:hypothetical protein
VVLIALWVFLTLNPFNVCLALFTTLLTLLIGILVSGTLTPEERATLKNVICVWRAPRVGDKIFAAICMVWRPSRGKPSE